MKCMCLSGSNLKGLRGKGQLIWNIYDCFKNDMYTLHKDITKVIQAPSIFGCHPNQ